jgi:WD40 repeat protein
VIVREQMATATMDQHEWDVFISYASEDPDKVAQPLADLLRHHKLRVWLDRNQLRIGDSLSRKIDDGLARSRYGVVILSRSFFQKDFPQTELAGLAARQQGGHKVILPVWHDIDRAFVVRYSPIVADMLASDTARGLDAVASDIVEVVLADATTKLAEPSPGQPSPPEVTVVAPLTVQSPVSPEATPISSSAPNADSPPIAGRPPERRAAGHTGWEPVPKSGLPEHRPTFVNVRTIATALAPDSSLILSRDDKWLACTAGNRVLIMDFVNATVTASLCDNTGPVSSLTWPRYGRDGEYTASVSIVFGTTDGYVSWWDYDSGSREWRRVNLARLRDQHAGKSITAIWAELTDRLTFVHAGSTLISCVGGTRLREVNFQRHGRVVFARDVPVCVSTAIVSKRVLATSHLFTQVCLLRDSRVRSDLLKHRSWRPRFMLPSDLAMLPEELTLTDHIYGEEPPASLAADAHRLAVAMLGGEWIVVGLTSKTIYRHSVGHNVDITAIALSPNGQDCAVGTNGGRIYLYHAATGDLLQALIGHNRSIGGVTYTYDAQSLISWAEDGIRVWRA